MRHVSLFSGSGIGTLAAQAAGIATIAHAENDPACCYCLERLWPGVRLFRDVRDVTAESVADLGHIDIISGGFPCTDISTAGKGAGLGTEENPTRSGLWYEFARVIREVRPTWVLIENVPALRVRGGDRVTNDLEAMAYEWEAVVVGAWAVGAPHKRDRVWIVGRRLDDTQSRVQRTDAGSPRSSQAASEGEVRGWAVHIGRSAEDGRLVDASRGLADPIGNLCGRGGDESERGQEGRTTAGRTGETMADRPRQQRDERANGDGVGERGDFVPFDEWIAATGSLGGTRREWEKLYGELGHPASDDQRRAPVAAMHGAGKPAGGSSGERVAVCPECCQSAITAGLAIAGNVCGGCSSFLGYAIGPRLAGRQGEPRDDEPQQPTTQRAGDELADAAQQREREPNDSERVEPRSGEPRQDAGRGSRDKLAESSSCERGAGTERNQREHATRTGQTLARDEPTGCRWPSRPGERQHAWEAPRLVEFGLGDATDGLSRRVRSRANKSLLRMVGNAWCYPVAVQLFKAIVELEQAINQ